MSDPILRTAALGFAYDGLPVLAELSLDLYPGEMVALVGLNGSGKTTLLKLLSGVLTPDQGKVILRGCDVKGLTRREMARNVSIVPQESIIDVPFSVRDVVAMGRNPYLGKFELERELDSAAIEHALTVTDTKRLETRLVTELSGGEAKRVLIARALAQETPIILFDEPTAHLDLAHQLEILHLLRDLARRGHTIFATMHDLSLAGRYFERMVILSGGTVAANGEIDEVLTEENVSRYFGVEVQIERHDSGLAIMAIDSFDGEKSRLSVASPPKTIM